MDRSELLDHLTEDVLTYVMHGGYPDQQLASELKYDGLDERFDDYETLVGLHFVLRPDVVRFVEALPDRLRGLKTETENVASVARGKVDGRVNWSATLRERYSRNPRDSSLFVCENRSEEYDIPENLVFKRLLSVIYETLQECEEYLRQDYEWVTDRWHENLELVREMKELFERNVHVRRIRDPEEYEPTERMLQRAADSRSEVYRRAASLLRTYRRTIDGERDAIRELLDETAITPDDDETLLELFVLFKCISTIEDLRDEQFRLRTIESGSQEVARMDGNGTDITLYHDQSAKDRGLSFSPVDEGKPRSELSRPEMVEQEARSVLAHYFKQERRSAYTKRPDVIVLEIREGREYEYLITEVKHSTRKETIQRGIEETLEYLAFLKQDGEFVFDSETDYFGSGWNGMLVVQDIAEETLAFENQREEPIRILQASEVEEKLRTVLENAVT